MKKLNYFFIALLAVLFILCFGVMVHAEGSRELNPSGGGYRAYTEYDTLTSTGIPRQTALNVYAKKGETIYMGTSETDSYDQNDIVLKNPTGIVVNYDVTAEKGCISTREQELNGPDVDGSKGSDYYTPVSYTALTDGIFEVCFHPSMLTTAQSVDPKPESISSGTLHKGSNAAACIAAWDISVYGTDGEYKPGRVYTNYIALNVGNNTQPIYPNVHVLTQDGYEYKVDFNGMRPWGFILFSNNRGLVDFTNRRTLYKNAVFYTNKQERLYGNVIAPNPSLTDEGKNHTHKIFFNTPSKDLPASIPTVPQVAATFNKPTITSNIKSTSDGTSWSEGITVKAEFSKVCTYTMVIDTDGDGQYTPGEDAIIRDAAAKGTNYIIWDGRNDNGEIVKTGHIDVILFVKSGEAHLPYLDVEHNPNGMKVELVNKPEEGLENKNIYAVYYDNRQYTTSNGTKIDSSVKPENGTPIDETKMPIHMAVDDSSSPSPKVRPSNDTSNIGIGAIDSRNGAGAYADFYGDMKIIDYWTYSRGFQQNPDPEMEGTPPEGAVIVNSDEVYDYVYYKTGYTIPNTESNDTYGYVHGIQFLDRGLTHTREQNDLAIPVKNDVYFMYNDGTEKGDQWEKYYTKVEDGFFDAVVTLQENTDTNYTAYLTYNSERLWLTNPGEHDSGVLKYNLEEVYITVNADGKSVTEVSANTEGAKSAIKITGTFPAGKGVFAAYDDIGFSLINYPDAKVKVSVDKDEYLLSEGGDNYVTFTLEVTNNDDEDISEIVVYSHVPINHTIDPAVDGWVEYDPYHNIPENVDEYGNMITDEYFPYLGKWQISRLKAHQTRWVKIKATASSIGDYTVTADMTGYNEYINKPTSYTVTAELSGYNEYAKNSANDEDPKVANNYASADYSIYEPIFGFLGAEVTQNNNLMAMGQFIVSGTASEILNKYNVYQLGFAVSKNLKEMQSSISTPHEGIQFIAFQELYKQLFETEAANPEAETIESFRVNEENAKYYGAALITNVVLSALTEDAPLYIQGFTMYNNSDNTPSNYYIREEPIYKIIWDTIEGIKCDKVVIQDSQNTDNTNTDGTNIGDTEIITSAEGSASAQN